jgi:hypothetical protein
MTAKAKDEKVDAPHGGAALQETPAPQPPLEPVESEPLTLKAPPAPESTGSRLKAGAPRESPPPETGALQRCYVLQAFAHIDRTYQPGEWLELPADWALHHTQAGNVIDYAGYLARGTNPGGNQ